MTAATTPAGRLLALGRAEATLLRRNRTAMFMALALPLVLVGALSSILDQAAERTPGLDVDANLIAGSMGVVLLIVVYCNLTTAYTARRSELVLKRLRTGEATDTEILIGTAAPSIALALVQCLLLGVGGALLLDLPVPVNPLLMLLGVVLTTALLAALAAVSSAVTKTVESAGITTLPLLLVAQLGSGLMVPLESLPDSVADVCRLLPTTPALQLLRIGWFGTDGSAPSEGFAGTWGQGAVPLLLAAVWTAVAVWAARRWFRWEPRR
ncbi:ABC transporter permease [Kitasatospora cheerisanensis]|uniref:Transport permease protein n=1 Tax=Kitasatospora cheerisanensis KCTC 2395 TaxID=1348663 RepID=A0A066YS97_9ACTN|nr:ABC transporter permease [Kitasatospora cheerisanensis]KDN84097.1 membrane protein [Kitasatospora cheerisanensis KCTC 2395]